MSAAPSVQGSQQSVIPPFTHSWVFQPLGQLGGVSLRPTLASHVACPSSGMQPPPPRYNLLQPLPATPHTQARVGPAMAESCTPSQTAQLGVGGGDRCATTSAGSTPRSLPVGTLQQPSSATFTPGGTVLPSADEQQLHALISKLRLALDVKDAAACALGSQLEALQRQLMACHAERRGLQLQLLEGQRPSTHGGPGGPSHTSPASGSLLQELRQQLSREAQQAAEARAECDALRAQVAALKGQLDATVQAGTQEHERLSMEAAQCRLLCRARARQLEQLQAQLDEVVAAHGAQEAAAAARVGAAEAGAVAAGREAADVQERAQAAELAAAKAERDALVAQEAAVQADSRCSLLQAEVAELRQHADWQAQRIETLQQSAAGQLIRKYDIELHQLRAQHEAERRQLQADLACARAGQLQQGATPAGPSWEDIFDEAGQDLHASDVQEAAVQTEGVEDACSTKDVGGQLVEEANEEIERLQHAYDALQEVYTAVRQELGELRSSQQHLVSPAERDAAVHQAATERALAADLRQRAEAAWRERLALLEGQLAHKCAEVQTLRSANERLELAANTLKGELTSVQQEDHVQLSSLQKLCARQERELRCAREEVLQLTHQVEELHHALLQQQEQAMLQYQQLKSEGMVELAEASAKSQRAQHRLRDCPSGAEEELQLAVQAQTTDSGSQCEPGPPGAEAAVQTEPPALLRSEPGSPVMASSAARFMGARELQAELAKIDITSTRLQFSRRLQSRDFPAQRQTPRPSPPGGAAAPTAISPTCAGLEVEQTSPAGSGMFSPLGAVASEESYATPMAGTPTSLMSVGTTPECGALAPLPPRAVLADISPHASFQREAPPMEVATAAASMPNDEDDAFRNDTWPGSAAAAAYPTGSGSERQPAGVLSRQGSEGDAPLGVWASTPARTRVPRLLLQHLPQPSSASLRDILGSSSPLVPPLASPPDASLPTLRSSTGLSSSLSSPRCREREALPAASLAPPATYGWAPGWQTASSSILADIINLKHGLVPARSGWPAAAGSPSESMQTRLDASLERLARLTGGIALH